ESVFLQFCWQWHFFRSDFNGNHLITDHTEGAGTEHEFFYGFMRMSRYDVSGTDHFVFVADYIEREHVAKLDAAALGGVQDAALSFKFCDRFGGSVGAQGFEIA